MLWRRLGPLPVPTRPDERWLAHDGGRYLVLERPSERGQRGHLLAWDLQEASWHVAPRPGLRRLAVEARGRILACSSAKDSKTFAWTPGEPSWRELGPGPGAELRGGLSLTSGEVLALASAGPAARSEVWMHFEPQLARWRQGPALGLRAPAWTLIALDRGSRVLALDDGPPTQLAIFDRASAQVSHPPSPPELRAPFIVHAGPEAALYWVGHRELRRAPILLDGGERTLGAGRTRLRLSGRRPSAVFTAAGQLALSGREGLALLALSSAERCFADSNLPAPSWRTLDLPHEHLERVLDDPDALRFVSAGDLVVALDLERGEGWLAVLGPDGPWRRDPPPSARGPGAAAKLVDWLVRHGDPRASALRFELEASRDHAGTPFRREGRPPRPPKLRPASADRVLEAWAAEGHARGEVELEREHGFITAARVATPPRTSGPEQPSAIAMLGEAPSAAFLSRLELVASAEAGDLAHYLDELARSPHLPRIHELIIGPNQRASDLVEASSKLQRWLGVEAHASGNALGSLAPLARLAATLRHLELTGTDIRVVALDLPELDYLSLRSPGLSRASLVALAESSTPRLRSLELWLGRGPLVPALLDTLSTTPLGALGLHGGGELDRWLPALLGHPVLAQLKRLDLSANRLGGRTGRSLVSHAPALAGLERLVLNDNRFGPVTRRQLTDAFGARVELG